METIQHRTHEFVAPSGYTYIIREQNGEDEEILSNSFDAKTLMNLTKFIAAIVVKTDFTPSGKLTIEQAKQLPVLDRYTILFQSRIFSLGEFVEFNYKWPDGSIISYEQDLNEFLFDDYSQVPEEEILDSKPNAIPYYPLGKQIKDIEYKLASGKSIKFDLLNGHSESWLGTLPENKMTRNSELLAHNLYLEVEGQWEKVQNFKLFSVRDMAEMRKYIMSVDPQFSGLSDIEHPVTKEKSQFMIITAPSFFFLMEA